ncbi:hypothetical protein SELMODRAFT_425137 [Selaginella moellendorffii]|uniref:Uncharacterized protein n=1 Tax=Selaginella moellendorffii TaxID=88036 RepID=D8SS48_SELML|nr:hypothetical protein SELMODRAFT_425137 [Selaginella moellendorffii]
MAAGSSGGASEGGGDEEVVNHSDHDPHIVLKKSSSRDYSRVMCETLTYSSGGQQQQQRGLSSKAMNGSGMMMMERQGSIRNGGSSARYAAPSKRSYFGHHFLGCFPGSRSSKTRSSLGLIPKLVLADHPGHGAAAVAEMMMVASGGGGGGGGGGGSMRCGSTKGGPTFSRVPADSARGSYSEPTSPQVTCIGQVKVRSSSSSSKKKKKLKNSKTLPATQPAPSSIYCNGRSSGGLLLRSKSKRSSISSPLASPARFARSNSSRKGGELFDAAVRAVQESVVTSTCKDQDPDTSYEIDLTDFARDSIHEEDPPPVSSDVAASHQDKEDQDGNHDREQVAAAKDEESEEEDQEEHSDSRSNSPTGRGSTGTAAAADVIAQHRQLAIEVCQALAAASNSSNLAPDRRHHGDEQDRSYHEEQHLRPAAVDVCVKKAAALTLKRLDSLGASDPSPRACLWMRRSIGRPLALDLSRKHRRN